MKQPACLCAHAKSRHRQQYGEPFKGACRDCECTALRLAKDSIRPATDDDWKDFAEGRID